MVPYDRRYLIRECSEVQVDIPDGRTISPEQRRKAYALMGEIASPGTLINPVRMFSLINSGAATFTGGENDHVWHLARVALAMGGGVSTETVPVA